MLLLLFLHSTALVGALVLDPPQPVSEELIRYVNEQSGARWRAANSSRFRKLKDGRFRFGALFEPEDLKRSRHPTVHHGVGVDEVPDSFDARDMWPHCAATIGKVHDQANCGACWAFSSTGAMSDRTCIASEGQVNVELSPMHLVSCCWYCGHACDYGYAAMAWDYWTLFGVVTGSSNEEGRGCQPYPYPKCAHFGHGTYPPCPETVAIPTECVHACQEGYPVPYDFDKHYGLFSYNLPMDERQIRIEIMTHGPVSATFIIYEDFLTYTSGIYRHVSETILGGHSVKLIGWGVEDDTPYWLAVNWWNEQWGEKGLFRVYRGINECAIEQEVNAGSPRI